MDPESTAIAQETFDHLPKDIQEVIFSDDYQTILENTAKEFNLTMEQKNKLEFETTMVLMGVNKRIYYPFDLELDLGIEEDVAQTISKEVNSTVFATVEESLQKIEQEDMGDEKELDAKLDYEKRRLDAENPEDKPVDANLSSLADRLKQASIATPAKRDYSLTRDAAPASIPQIISPTPDVSATSARPAIDPYHESIDNE